MSDKARVASSFQRNAFAPGLVAAAVLFVAPVLMGDDWFTLVLFVTAILAAIVGWFSIQARQWWWAPVFLAIAVIWNPVMPLPLTGPVWAGAQLVAAVVFLVAGVLIKVPRA